MDNQQQPEDREKKQEPHVSYYDAIRASEDPVSLAKQAITITRQRGGIYGLMAVIAILLAIPFVVITSQQKTRTQSGASAPAGKTVQAFLTGHVFFDEEKSGIEKNPGPDGVAGVEIIVDNKPVYTDSNGNFSAEVAPGVPDSSGNLTDKHHVSIIPLPNTAITSGPLFFDRQANTVVYFDNDAALKRQNNPYGISLSNVLPKPISIGLGRLTDPQPSVIQGYTFRDENGNGVFDADIEPVIPLVSVTVNGVTVKSDTTGFFRVTSLSPNGQYTISATPPEGLRLTTPFSNQVTTGRHDVGFK